MVTKEKVIEELQWISERISTQIRTLGLGILAITWGLLIGQPQIAGPIPYGLKKNLLIIGVLALVAVICDFSQYFFAYINAKGLFDRMEAEEVNKAEYDYATITYKLRTFFFWTKQILLLIACLWFLVVIIPFCIEVACGSKACT